MARPAASGGSAELALADSRSPDRHATICRGAARQERRGHQPTTRARRRRFARLGRRGNEFAQPPRPTIRTALGMTGIIGQGWADLVLGWEVTSRRDVGLGPGEHRTARPAAARRRHAGAERDVPMIAVPRPRLARSGRQVRDVGHAVRAVGHKWRSRAKDQPRKTSGRFLADAGGW